ncbi:uncharacterized protein LOC124887044 [Capsicum annuum]|uniref:uncharacterized protein LOC124887044 n=1 Tax=Capsicum annuum TaxID=4072 RepID=UPI001FB0FC94|nr:uncharacterized protein LOC124887044 [Capsicum annuum]
MQRKKTDDAKFSKFLAILKQLTINVLFIEALEKMPGYAKFIKYLITKKSVVSYELEEDLHLCSTISIRTLMQKKSDPGAVSIPYMIGTMEFTKALCDLGASVNLMSLTIYKNLGLGNPTPTDMRLVMADRSVKRPIVILYDVLVKVSNFIFPADFIILDCEVDFKVLIIFGRPFLVTRSMLIDLRANELLFRVNNKEVQFDVGRSMKQHMEISMFSVVDVYSEDE